MRFAGKTTRELGRSCGSFGGFSSSTFIHYIFKFITALGSTVKLFLTNALPSVDGKNLW